MDVSITIGPALEMIAKFFVAVMLLAPVLGYVIAEVLEFLFPQQDF
jgi:hypothetical protein